MAPHTYEFLRKRRNDPKWRPSYIKARNSRIISFFGSLIIIIFIGFVYLRYQGKDVSEIQLFIDNIILKVSDFFNYVADYFKK